MESTYVRFDELLLKGSHSVVLSDKQSFDGGDDVPLLYQPVPYRKVAPLSFLINDLLPPHKTFGDLSSYPNGPDKIFTTAQIDLIKDKMFSIYGMSFFDDPSRPMGIIVKDQNNVSYCLDAFGTISDIEREIFPRVSIHLMKDVMWYSKGPIVWRLFEFPAKHVHDHFALTAFIHQFLETPPQMATKTLWRSTLQEKRAYASHSFSSELTTLLFLTLHYLDESYISDTYYPLSAESFRESTQLTWLNGIRLGKELIKKG
jgi:hypothetical protein